MSAANRAAVLALLRAHHQRLANSFGACQLGVFGSAARDELRADSDVDVLVDFANTPSYDAYFGLKDALEQLLGRPVDLVTTSGLKPRARIAVEKDLIRVA